MGTVWGLYPFEQNDLNLLIFANMNLVPQCKSILTCLDGAICRSLVRMNCSFIIENSPSRKYFDQWEMIASSTHCHYGRIGVNKKPKIINGSRLIINSILHKWSEFPHIFWYKKISKLQLKVFTLKPQVSLALTFSA